MASVTATIFDYAVIVAAGWNVGALMLRRWRREAIQDQIQDQIRDQTELLQHKTKNLEQAIFRLLRERMCLTGEVMVYKTDNDTIKLTIDGVPGTLGIVRSQRTTHITFVALWNDDTCKSQIASLMALTSITGEELRFSKKNAHLEWVDCFRDEMPAEFVAYVELLHG